ncbi:MAG: ABC transporter ATP-binding protein [Patescibacteria group bacterium]
MQNNTKATLKIYWQHLGNYKISAFVIFVTVVAASILNAIVPIYFKQFFNLLNQSQTAGLMNVLFMVAALELLQWVFWRINTFTTSYFESNIIADITNSCFKYLHKHSFSFFNNNFVGSLVKRVNRFTMSFEDLADKTIFNLLPLATTIIVILIVLFERNILLGAGMLLWIIIFLIINGLFTRYKIKYDLLRSAADSRATGFMADTITNNSNVKLFVGYNREVGSFKKINDEVRELRLFTWNIGSYFEAAQSMLMIGLEIGAFYLSISLWKQGILTVGDFVLVQSYLLIIFMKIWDFGKIIQRAYENMADAEEMTIILNTPHEIKDAKNAKNMVVTKGKIEFKNVNFTYNQTRSVLKNFNLTIAPREKVALVGPSGAGKSTIARLLLRMHDVVSGKILVDDQKISNIKLESLWKNVSMVPQDPVLFHRSLMENIRYGKPDADDEEVIEASKLAHCHEFISDFPEKYETHVGERGIKLSGGERQRVAIARAILHNAPILILDEATSSLDSESERLIQVALDALIKGKTVIVIAHRLSTIMKMDRILVIKDGGIIEDGPHKELLTKRDGIYRKLWQVQAGGFIDADN